ncbi:MAG: hypothetical protein GX649_10160 [Chloroflexi bacterium]|nr:hypothetical protein [Chloroflexota bacterium]
MEAKSTGNGLEALRSAFADPPREYGMLPFWFWNDDLQEEELLRQIREFHAQGLGGFIPHARIGLSPRVGYLTEEYFRLLRLCVEEAARLGMKVVLYDEGSYPSGSAEGRVVAENPEHAARCLICVQREVKGPAKGYWRPNSGRALGDTLVAVVQARETDDSALDPDSLALLEPGAHDLVPYDLPEGRWRLLSFWSVFSGGTIRGVYAWEEDGHATAPAAGDIMNPEAVASFIRLTHDAYYAHLGEHFGSTIVGMFTDEPSPTGRGPRRGPRPWPYTPGFIEYLQPRWDGDVRRWLPALWADLGERGEAFRVAYRTAVYDRLGEVFYAAQRDWCAAHGIALTGHPSASDEMGALRYFHWPGQDMVWRYVEPGNDSALVGEHSVAAKGAGSAAALDDRPRNATEVLGAYGWRLTLDESKWLCDWHLVRGNNLFFSHACFYSIRDRRAYESEPDIGVHNVWWPHFRLLGDHIRRCCWLLSEGVQVQRVAVLTDAGAMSWRAAKALYEGQMGFVYLDDAALQGAAIADGTLAVGNQRLRAVVVDAPGPLSERAAAQLDAFREAGGLVIETWQPETLVASLAEAIGRDVMWSGGPDLRVLRYRKGSTEFYLLVNEGEEPIAGDLAVEGAGALERWNPQTGTGGPWPARAADGYLHTHLRLERREATVLAVDPAGQGRDDLPTPPAPGDVISTIGAEWQATDLQGEPVDAPALADWAQAPGWEIYTGTLSFRTTFDLAAAADGEMFLDLGAVGDIAEVLVNGQPVGVRAWAPYVVKIGSTCRAGANTLEVRVTNSMANAYEGEQHPSGLMGPVTLRRAQD